MEFKVGTKIKRKDTNLEAVGGKLEPETVRVLKACNFTGEISQVQDGLVYVGFKSANGWVTQVFKPEEIEVI